MGINFTYLYLAGAGIVFYAAALLLLIALYFSKRKKISFAVYFARLTAILLLLLSVSAPFLEKEKISKSSYALLDISDSNHEPAMQELIAKLEVLKRDMPEIEIIPFAGNSLASSVSSVDSYRVLKNDWSKLDIGQSNLEKAFKGIERRTAGSVILLSDGFETVGDVSSTIPSLKQAGFKVYPLLPENPGKEQEQVVISNLHAPLIARSGSSVEIKTSLRNSTTTAQRGLLSIKHGEKTVYSESVSLPAESEQIFTTQSDSSQEGIKEITAVFTPSEKSFSASSRTIYLSGEKGEKILLLNGAQEDERFLKPVLQNQAYQLKSLLPDDLKSSAPDLSEYKSIILNNIALNQLPKGFASTLEDYVENGGGFVMIGGNRSFGLGGYINSAVEDILPVNLLPPQKEEKRLNVAVQLLIDKSRSMADGSRIDFAKEAAIEVVANLKDDDYLGVLGFDVNPFVVIRLSRLADIRSEAARRIGLLYPNKGTSLVASIDEGRRDLVRANAGRKHMLILTDGEITDAPRHYYFEMIKQVRLLGITVSTVMLGSEGDQSMLQQMADLGGGAFYRTADARSLPKIFISDLKVASGERTLKEQTDYFVKTGPAGVLSTSIESYPDVRGYVQTRVKEKANLELVAIANNKADPLLATWTYGKGKSIAFTSDANGRWSQSWIGWSRFQIFWQNIIDSLGGEAGGNKEQVKFDLKTYYQNAKLNLDLSIFSEPERSNVEAEIIFPDKTSHSINMKSVAPGRYLSDIDNPKAGKYEVRARIGSKNITPVAFDLSGELLGEVKGQGFNIALLQNLAQSTGGKVNPLASELKGQQFTSKTKKDISVYLILAALALVVIEILIREGALSLRKFKIPKRITS